jgi:hypothetical protein
MVLIAPNWFANNIFIFSIPYKQLLINIALGASGRLLWAGKEVSGVVKRSEYFDQLRGC